MALHLMRKVNNFNLLLSRGLICRHSSSSNSSNSSAGGHGDQGKHGNKSGQEAQQSKELANKDFEESSAVEKKDDSTTTLPSLKEKEERQLAQIRKMYEGTGVEVVKHEMFRGITRREGVTGEVFPGTDEPKDLVKVLKGSYGLKKWYRGREPPDQPLLVPRQTDVAIIGGGVMGSAVAFWLKQKYPEGLSVTVVERDPTYTQASTVLSVGGLRQQFSLPENIEMSLYTAEFFRNLRDHLTIHDQDPPDIQFNPQGYLFLATKEGSKTIEQNYTTQCSLGAAVEVMNRDRLKEKFPWLNVDDLECGSYGLEDEGWFDPWSLLTALRSKAIHLGAEYVRGEAVGFRYTNREVKELGGSERQMKDLDGVEVKAEDGNIHPMQFEKVINCAGPWAGEVGKLAGIGIDGGELKIPIPVEPRKRYVFVLHCPEGPGLEMPIINDPSGLFVRREGLGGHYICGMSLQPDNEPSCDDLAVDYEYFNEVVWPLLAHRIPTFEKLKANESLHMGVERGVYKKYVQPLITKRIPCLQNAKLRSAWAGYYDYNYFDQNLIVGNHPYHKNFYMATGCSGHGIQQAPAVGKLLMELMTEGKFKTIDVQRFMFDRLLSNKRILEQNIV